MKKNHVNKIVEQEIEKLIAKRMKSKSINNETVTIPSNSLTEAPTERLLRSAAMNLKSQWQKYYSRGKTYSKKDLRNFLDSTPLGKALKPEDLDKIADMAMNESLNEETFTAVKKDTGKVSVFSSKETRDAAIKAGTHEKHKADQNGKQKDTKSDVNIFEPDSNTSNELDQPPKDAKQYTEPQVAAQLDKLAAMANQAKAKGENAPDFDLCQVSIPGTNLFCAGNKGIPRAEMPQLKGKPAPNTPAAKISIKTGEDTVDGEKYFVNALKKMGVKMIPKKINADTLKSTQSQLVGTKVAGMAKALEADPKHPAITAPIFVSKDGYVLDGHHRWAAQVGAGILSDKPVMMNVIEVDMPIDKLVNYSNEFATKFGIAQKAGKVKESVNESDMTRHYDGFKILDMATKDVYKFKYVKGIKNTRVELEAISKLAKKTGRPQSNFGVTGFVKKGTWATDNTDKFTESKNNKNILNKLIKEELESFISNINENATELKKIMQVIKNRPGPFTLIAIDNYRRKVVKQEHVRDWQLIPAYYREMEKKYANAIIHVEDSEGKQVYKESVNEVIEPQTKKIAALTGTRPEAVKHFVSMYGLNITKLLKFLEKAKLSDRMDFVTAITGKPGNKYQGEFVGNFGESINEGTITINAFGETEKLNVKLYKDKTGHPYVSLYTSDGEPYADITVILPETKNLPKDEFFAKGWSENKEIVLQLIKNKVLIPTAKKAATGMVTAHSFKLNPKYK